MKSESKIDNSESDIKNSDLEKADSESGTENNHVTSIVDNISSTLLGEMPEVQQHAIDNEAAQQEEKHEKYAGLRDREGNSFDPTIHKVNKQGEPTLSPQGNLIKKPGRKKGDLDSGSIIGVKKDNKPDPQTQVKAQARASGTMAANLLITLGMVAGGEEWRPLKDDKTGMDEKLMLETSFADYFEATGRTDIPPGMALAVAIGGYVLPRFTMPKTRSRLSKVKDWLVAKIAARKLKKHNLKVTPVDTKKDEGIN